MTSRQVWQEAAQFLQLFHGGRIGGDHLQQTGYLDG